MRFRSLVISVVLAPLLATVYAQSPTRLIQPDDLEHVGSFTIPDMVDATGSDRQPCNYVQGTLAYNPGRDSLFLVCHDWTQTVAEISIPELGGQATQLQAPRSAANLGLINPTDPNDKKIGGLYVSGDKLIVSAYAFYDATATATASHFVRSTNLTANDVVGPIRVGTLNPGFTAGYMGVVPAEWQAALGGDFVTGLNGLSINSRTSHGPSLSSVSLKALLAAPASIASSTLVAYPLDANAQFSAGNPTTEYWGANSANRGVVIPPGTNTVLFIGPYGAGTYCYGGSECNDPTSPYQGTHTYPYFPRVWAYRTSDLADVKAGHRQAHSLYPYAMWYLPAIGFQIGGVAYDIPGNRLFISDRFGDGAKPRIHVFQLRGVTAPPPAPVTLRIARE